MAELRRLMSSLCQQFQPLSLPEDEEELAVKLRNLYLGEEGSGGQSSEVKDEEEVPASFKEKQMKARVCKTVLSSFDMSLQDVSELASRKLDLATMLIQQLGDGSNPGVP